MKTKAMWSLFKIMSSNIFSFGSFIEGFKKGVKGVLKNIFVILITIYLIVVAGGMYILIMNNLGNNLLASGDIEKMPVYIMFIALCVVFFFGFVSAATNYYTGCGEEQFLAMPLKPVDIFGAKVGVTAITDASFGAAVVIVGSIIYGIKAQLFTNPLFYLGMISTTLAIVSISLFVIYGLLILVLMLFPKMRKRSILTGVATVLIFIFVCGYSFFSSQMSMSLDLRQGSLPPIIQIVRLYAEKAPFLMIFANAISGKIVSILLMAAISLAFIFGIVPALAPLYIKTLNGFSDVKSKKISRQKAQDVITKNVKTNSVFGTLFTRDLRTMFREPSFFANGPLMIIILPIIMLVSGGMSFFMASHSNVNSVMNELQRIFLALSPDDILNIKYFCVLGVGAFSIFMGNCTNVASTSFSREGKALYDLKAMPITCDTIVLVKFWHAFMYCIIAVAVSAIYFSAGVAVIGFPFTAGEVLDVIVKGGVLGLLGSLVLVFGEMFIDTFNPKLQWENPIAAFKQNVNAVVSSFITMGVVALFIVLMVFLPRNNLGIIITGLIFTVLAAPLGYLYFRYAVKRIPNM